MQNIISLGSQHLKKDNEEILIEKANAFKYFKKLYMISPLNTSIKVNYNKDVSEEEYNLMVKNLILHEVDFSVMTNNLLAKNILVFKKQDLEIINKFNLELSDNLLVIPILSVSYSNVIKFSSNNIDNDLKSLYIYLTLIDYFGKDKLHFNTRTNIDKKIDNIRGNNYYALPFNTNKNFSIMFNQRSTNYKMKTKYNNYDFILKKEKFLSLASIKYKNNDLFTLTPKADISKLQFTKLFDYLMVPNNINNSYRLSKSNINLINKCLVNPKYCHLVINNYNILSKIKDIITNRPYYKSLIGYAWIRLYQDESILGTKLKNTDDIVFDINTANLLPNYQQSSDNAYISPYLPILVDKKSLNFENNILSLMPYTCNINNFGVCNLNEFKKRLNLFCTNDYNKNLFENIDFKENKMVICGSVMTACLPKGYNLLHLFEKNQSGIPLSRFFTEYYSEADIDVCINVKNHFKFCKNVSNIFNQIVLNFCGIYPYGEPKLIKKKPIKKIFLFVKESYADEVCKSKNVILNDIRYNQDKLFDIFKETVIQEHDFNILKQNNLDENDKQFVKSNIPEFNYTYEELLKNEIEININITIHKNIYENNDDISDNSYHGNKNFAMRVEYKYKVYSPILEHDLEIFQNRTENPFGIINNFHLNCVRCYYDGNNVYLTPSCITSYMTHINMDYKYFVSNKSPWEIINKYRMRGFGTLLNNTEIEQYVKYSKETPFWKNLYGNKYTGFMTLESNLYKPRIFNIDHFINSKSMVDENNPGYKNIKINDFIIFNNYNDNKGNIINPLNGNIIPIKSYYLDIDYAIDNMKLDILI
jgi:hypothetical protein